jgi:hypothetical protein
MGIKGNWRGLERILTCRGFNLPQSLPFPMVLRETEQDLKQSYLDDCKYRSKQQKALHLYHHPRTKYCPKNEFESQMGRKAMNLNVLIRQI